MILSRTPPWLGALLLIGIAFTARAILDPLLGDRSPFLFFTLVVLIAGARFGVLVGVAVAAASTVLGTWAFLPPRYAFGTMTSNEWTNVVAFCVTSVAMLIFVDKLTKSRASEAARVAENRTVGDQLRQSEQRLASIVNSAMDAIVTIDDAQLIALFNPAAERMFGYSASAVLGEPITKLIPERFRDGHHAHVQAFRKEGVTSRRLDSLGTIYGMRASGEEFPIEASISHVVVDDQNLTTVILRDTTERTLNEEKQTLLAREVDHRAKNALAVAQALVSLTPGETIEEYTAAVTGRISSLARAHSLLSRSQWANVSCPLLSGPSTMTVWIEDEGPPVSHPE